MRIRQLDFMGYPDYAVRDDEQVQLILESSLGSTTLSRQLGVSKQAILYWRNKFVKEESL